MVMVMVMAMASSSALSTSTTFHHHHHHQDSLCSSSSPTKTHISPSTSYQVSQPQHFRRCKFRRRSAATAALVQARPTPTQLPNSSDDNDNGKGNDLVKLPPKAPPRVYSSGGGGGGGGGRGVAKSIQEDLQAEGRAMGRAINVKVYDPQILSQKYKARPLKVVRRSVQIVVELGGFALKLVLDQRSGMLEVNRRTRAVELREIFTRLGPTFVKVGQGLSTRPDLCPPEFLEELSQLQGFTEQHDDASVLFSLQFENKCGEILFWYFLLIH